MAKLAKTPKRKPAGQRIDEAYQKALKKDPTLTQGTIVKPGTPEHDALMKRLKRPASK